MDKRLDHAVWRPEGDVLTRILGRCCWAQVSAIVAAVLFAFAMGALAGPFGL
jgi:hypothetical protein